MPTGDGNDATTSDADGGDGNSDNVGGLVGRNNGGIITASYATGSVNGGTGNFDSVGGLVGINNSSSSITASYATGSVNGGNGNFDSVGGLVGIHDNSSITASYATGEADGGSGASDVAGGLGGENFGATITASYGFGTVTNEETAGSAGSTKPIIGGVPITSATQLNDSGDVTTGDAGGSPWWNTATSTTAGAWDFGTAIQNPALVYSDYDGTATVYASCTSDNGGFPTTIPGTADMLVCGTTLVGGYRAP